MKIAVLAAILALAVTPALAQSSDQTQTDMQTNKPAMHTTKKKVHTKKKKKTHQSMNVRNMSTSSMSDRCGPSTTNKYGRTHGTGTNKVDANCR